MVTLIHQHKMSKGQKREMSNKGSYKGSKKNSHNKRRFFRDSVMYTFERKKKGFHESCSCNVTNLE
ncbi:Uncharacterized protein APZ42_004488 [Daphnia magna]|uniref:Uncharacterized protein n=1 Tax=Daphnia magna TaxID=35525 RepID=A0A162F0D4_9CRUS|nr:Uncharacterized protein APZ42_004488 [Daphnia magna]